MKKINLYWHKTRSGNGNFGDELNHFIVSKLSGLKVNQILIPSTGLDYIYKGLSSIYNRNISIMDIPNLIKQFFIVDFIVGIGSVIAIPNNSKAKIWGSGIIKRDDNINKALFYAVRGTYTQERLKEHDYLVPDVIGDPGLLLPLVYDINIKKKYKLGIIPHYIHYESIMEKINEDSILIINLLDPIEKIIKEIVSCEFTISTSLHGIIVSHAFKVPSLWYVFSEKQLAGDNIKFYDYFSSVGIEEYEAFSLELINFDLEKNIEIFKSKSQITMINKDLIEIQQQLINIAPFPVLKKYKNIAMYKGNSNNVIVSKQK